MSSRQHGTTWRPGGLRHTIRANTTRITVTGLTAGWAALIAGDLTGWAEIAGRIHDDLAAVLTAGTAVAATVAVLRGRLLYEAMRFGRLVEAERRQRAEQSLMDAPTHGVGVHVN